jgi:hypothetical protein
MKRRTLDLGVVEHGFHGSKFQLTVEVEFRNENEIWMRRIRDGNAGDFEKFPNLGLLLETTLPEAIKYYYTH